MQRPAGRVAVELGHAADADAVAETGDRDLVGFVHDRRLRCLGVVGDRQRDRITLDRVDRQADVDRPEEFRTEGTERRDIGVPVDPAEILGHHAQNPVALDLDRADALAVVKLRAKLGGLFRQRHGEHAAIAGAVGGQSQAADELVADEGEGRFGRDAAVPVQHLERAVEIGEDRLIGLRCLELLLGAEKLERALFAEVEADAGLGDKLRQQVARIVRDADHARLVDGVGFLVAVGEHLGAPVPHPRADERPDEKRTALHEEPFQRLHRHPGRRPRRGHAVGKLARIGIARLHAGAGLTVEHDHLGAVPGEVVGGGDADHPGAHDDDFHVAVPQYLRPRSQHGADAAPRQCVSGHGAGDVVPPCFPRISQ